MELYFLRHGIAEEHSRDGTDAARRLTAAGIGKLEAMAAGLKRLRLKVDLLLTSPLARAQQTAEIAGRHLGLAPIAADTLAPGCDAGQLLALLEGYPRAERVLLVGHEPDMSQMIGALTGGSRVVMKKGGLARVDMPIRDELSGALVWLLPPRALR